MTDKERILMIIVSRIIPGLMYSNFNKRDEYVKSYMLEPSKLQHGDLVFANTSIYPNDFMVGFVEQVDNRQNCVVIREIGTKRLCNYYNESFSVINKEKIGYEVLEGVQYKTYQKVLKAFSKYVDYCTRFKSISFEGDICTIQSRQMFSNDLSKEWSFKYNSKTSIKSIGNLITN
ncbi:hypothetical protein K144316041_p20620 (plasmid) [Clostridium tetani]|uniref:hypothetical protein n=1 Tax=Clostridium tetani TaxID=1513 RepID=UPI00295430AB|nr:hypothetical protein [Clostridium tetani]BDR74223.1 hypothetical protein K144316041_p20620 [Clostridium tetani]